MAYLKKSVKIGADRESPVLTFTNKHFKRDNLTQSVDLTGRELVIDDLIVELQTDDDKIAKEWVRLFSGIVYGTPVWYEVDDVNGKTKNVTKFFFDPERLIRTGRRSFQMTAISAVGILAAEDSVGGLYNGEYLKDILTDIIARTLTFEIDADAGKFPVYGWLPAQKKRDSIHALLLAFGMIIQKNKNPSVDLFFTPLSDKITQIKSDFSFYGGSVGYGQGVTGVNVTEHQFFKTNDDEIAVLFDNTDGSDIANETKIIFDKAPVYDITGTDNIVIHESGPNYAILSGIGVLRGKVYTHTTRMVSSGSGASGTEKNASVNNIYILNSLNSEIVAERLELFYRNAKSISMDIIRNDEKPGDLIKFTDPYGNLRTGYITDMESSATSFERARCTISAVENDDVLSQIRKLSGNAYAHSKIITTESLVDDRVGVWIVPDEMDGETVRISLFGGGNGGASGVHGQGGAEMDSSGGKGGAGGKGGQGGFIRTFRRRVSAGEQFIFVLGKGGEGGIASDKKDADENYISVAGTAGGKTRFGIFTTGGKTHFEFTTEEISVASMYGLRDLIAGKVYAAPGPDGILGGNSGPNQGDINIITDDNVSNIGTYRAEISAFDTRNDFNWDGAIVQYKDRKGNNYISYPGATGASFIGVRNNSLDKDIVAWGGSGGGAAVGASVKEDMNGYPGNISYSDGYQPDGGSGGKGADALSIFENIPQPGCGGSGGHGGGGGGLGGLAAGGDPHQRSNGPGGAGSDGQNGADGGILILSRTKIPDSSIKKLNLNYPKGNSIYFDNALDNIPFQHFAVTFQSTQENIIAWDHLTIETYGENPSDNPHTWNVLFDEFGPVGGGVFDVLKGILIVTHECISQYNDEDLPDGWIASETTEITIDEEIKTVPAKGATVIYPLGILDRGPIKISHFNPDEFMAVPGVNHFKVSPNTASISIHYHINEIRP